MIGRAAGESLDQNRRRSLVLAAFASLVVYVVASVLVGDTAWFWPIQLGWIAAAMIHIRVLRPATQEMADETDSLDERQSMVRNHAHYRAYRILAYVVLLPTFYAVIASRTELWFPDLTASDVNAIFVGFVWVAIMLPTSVIAWSEPDPEDDTVDKPGTLEH